ncbi:hypothetical protein EGR_10094 [Echinococcus granulosus]|uniref:Uncharacterized protein n=1 Tax=Echinococcus granulosus TaxID=6210 RepID=W6UNU4_ECHGR|nr:hypothetical protein EGR_10094 [Echinococcus granulosus]EUB55049.1 hypothetical protein EGR_10094 [Echinococcus granulosus]
MSMNGGESMRRRLAALELRLLERENAFEHAA